MARICRPCHQGDHYDCPRYLWQTDCCECLCDEAPRQLSLPLGDDQTPARPAERSEAGRATHPRDEAPW